MEDVDKIIISSIREIGCDIPEDIHLLSQCSLEQIIKMTVICLKTLKPEILLPTELPPSVSARFNMCGKIAHECSELGYKGEVGFQTFLYFNDSEIRKVFMFLVENILRIEKSSAATEAVEDNSVLSIPANISKAVRSLFNAETDLNKTDEEYRATVPFISFPLETGILIPGQKINCSPKEWKEFVTHDLPFINDQIIKSENLLPSIITLNTKGIIRPLQEKSSNNSYLFKDKANTDNEDVAITNDDDNRYKLLSKHVYNFNSAERELVLNNSTNAEFAKLKTIHTEEIGTEENEGEKELILERDSLTKQLAELNEKFLKVTKIYSEKKESIALNPDRADVTNAALRFLPESENTIPKLKEANEKIRNKIQIYTGRWEERKSRLQEKCIDLRQRYSTKTEQKAQLTEQISKVTLETKAIEEKCRNKMILNERLQQYRNSIKGYTTRIEYTTRILEIIANIKKQGKEIDKILSDTRSLQREITNLEDRIECMLIILDKHIIDQINYDDEDDFSADIYSDFMTVYKSYYDALKMDAENNAINREIKDYEEQINDLSLTVTAEAIERVTSDIDNLKSEQAYLKDQLDRLDNTT